MCGIQPKVTLRTNGSTVCSSVPLNLTGFPEKKHPHERKTPPRTVKLFSMVQVASKSGISMVMMSSGYAYLAVTARRAMHIWQSLHVDKRLLYVHEQYMYVCVQM